MNRPSLLMAALMVAAAGCSRSAAPSEPEPPTATVQAVASATPQAEPTAPALGPDEVCLPAGEDQVQYLSEAGGYCFLLPDTFEVTQDFGLDIFAVGPTLETFGMDRLALIVEFNVIGAPGGAGDHTPDSWGARIAAENEVPEIDTLVEPVEFGEADLEAVRVRPIPGMNERAAVFLRANDTLYGITVHPDRESAPDHATEVDALWETIESTTRFFDPMDTGVEYNTELEVCPDEEDGTTLFVDLAAGWCTLIPSDWRSDEAFDFPGRFVGGPDIGEFWPGQPPYANVVVGFGGPSGEISLEQRVEGRADANGRPDLVQVTETTIGGYPAAILDTQDGPHPERVALIQGREFLYSVLGQPYDSSRFPDAQPALEAAWDTIIGSIQFFEPYR